MIIPVDQTNLSEAAAVHAAAWRESHRAFCTPEFVEQHTTERQAAYLKRKLDANSRIFLLVEDEPKGVVSVTGRLIEDLYVLPEQQGRGYGTKLLRFAAAIADGTPTLWILGNNAGARRLYERLGFFETGSRKITPGGLDEIELALKPERMETERLILDRIKETEALGADKLDISAYPSLVSGQKIEPVPLQSFMANYESGELGGDEIPYILNVSKGNLDRYIREHFDEIVKATSDRDEELGAEIYMPSHETGVSDNRGIPLMITEHKIDASKLTDRKGGIHEIQVSESGDKTLIY